MRATVARVQDEERVLVMLLQTVGCSKVWLEGIECRFADSIVLKSCVFHHQARKEISPECLQSMIVQPKFVGRKEWNLSGLWHHCSRTTLSGQ